MDNSQRGPDGKCLMCRVTGGHDWFIDGKSTNGSGWTRTGTVPRISVKPSILIYGRDGKTPVYHGYLTNGILRSV